MDRVRAAWHMALYLSSMDLERKEKSKTIKTFPLLHSFRTMLDKNILLTQLEELSLIQDHSVPTRGRIHEWVIFQNFTLEFSHLVEILSTECAFSYRINGDEWRCFNGYHHCCPQLLKVVSLYIYNWDCHWGWHYLTSTDKLTAIFSAPRHRYL